MEIGQRKGKKRALHIPAILQKNSSDNAILNSLHREKEVAKIEQGAELKEGLSWIVVAPSMSAGSDMRLDELSATGRKLKTRFTGGTYRNVEITLDNRGRALNLEKGAEYSIRIAPWKKFFEMYERRSLPVGKGQRSEPDETGRERIMHIEEMSRSAKGRAFDAATGIKDYLVSIAEKCALTCGNLSPSMLIRTRDWLGGRKGTFVAYDAESEFPFIDSCFDLVVCDAMLEYIHQPLKALGEITRTIKKNGLLILLEPTRALTKVEEFYPQDLWEVALWRPLNDTDFNAIGMEKILQANGFEEVERHSISFDYPIHGEERFQQDIVRFDKLYI